jgi:serine/threonine-protein kinase RsbW
MVMTGGKVSFELRNSLSELDKVRRSLEEFGESLGLSKKCIFQINLAMEEVFSNIVSYGYTDNAEHWVTVTIWHENEAMFLRIEDDGIPFNPCEVEVPDLECSLEERQIGGLGCHLMRSVMDDIVYERRGNKNVLTMKKTIGKA